jgi:uncharacterized CHY-type Zn-finger protein
MKKIILTAVLILTVYITTMANMVISEGQSNTKFGSYKIVKLEEHFLLDGKELDKYLISYEKPEMKVIVAVDKQKKCKKYYVLTGELAIQYECNGKYFGIKKLDKEIVAKGFSTPSEILNLSEYYSQRVLSSETRATIDHLNLIASYYPGLIKDKIS